MAVRMHHAASGTDRDGGSGDQRGSRAGRRFIDSCQPRVDLSPRGEPRDHRRRRTDVPEHQDAGELRAAGDRRRDSRVGAAVRAEVERDGEAVEGERSGVRAGGRGGHGRGPSTHRRPEERRAAAQSRGRSAQGARALTRTLRARRRERAPSNGSRNSARSTEDEHQSQPSTRLSAGVLAAGAFAGLPPRTVAQRRRRRRGRVRLPAAVHARPELQVAEAVELRQDRRQQRSLADRRRRACRRSSTPPARA